MTETTSTTPSPETTEAAEKPTGWRRVWYEARPILVMLVVLFSFRSAVADYNVVPSGSMKPTIIEGDRIFVNKLAYDLKIPFTRIHIAQWADPKRGDVVVFDRPSDGVRLVKRVIGVPGDKVELRDNHLFINGEPATYAPLPADVSNQVQAAERKTAKYALEQILGQSHPVMSLPWVPAQKRTIEPV